MESYDFRNMLPSMYGRPAAPGGATMYPRVGQPGQVGPRPPPARQAPYPQPHPGSAPPSGLGIRVVIKPEYRITPPPPLAPQVADIPRSTFQFDFDVEKKILAEAEKGSQNWSRIAVEPQSMKTHASTSSAEPVGDPMVNKYVASGLPREAVSLRLAIAVHAVFIDSKFTLSDESKRLFADDGSTPSVLIYSIPRLAGPIAVVEFADDGNAVTVSGCLSRDGERSDVHRARFDILKIAAPLISSVHGAISDSGERAILDLWKEVRSKLSVPLRVGICYQKGIFLPPCFDCLPKPVKSRVLEVVPGFAHPAKAGCCCTKLGFLCELDEIWRRKFEEKFGAMSCRMREHALGWLKKRIANGDYDELLSSGNIDELNDRIPYFVAPTMVTEHVSSIRTIPNVFSFSLPPELLLL